MKSEQGLEQGGKLEVQTNTEAMEEHGVPFGLLILLLTQLRPVSLRVTSLTVGRPSAPIIFQGNALLWWNHFSLEALSLFPNYSSLFQVDKNWPAWAPFSQSHTLLGWYTTRTASSQPKSISLLLLQLFTGGTGPIWVAYSLYFYLRLSQVSLYLEK